MALEFTDTGAVSLEGREAVFEGGKAVNQPYWDYIKQIPDMVKDGRCYEISARLINDTFNPIIDPLTKTVLRSPKDQFIVFCESHNVRVQKNHLDIYILNHKAFVKGE